MGSGCHGEQQRYAMTILVILRAVFKVMAGCFVSLPCTHSVALLLFVRGGLLVNLLCDTAWRVGVDAMVRGATIRVYFVDLLSTKMLECFQRLGGEGGIGVGMGEARCIRWWRCCATHCGAWMPWLGRAVYY